jgi:hypothetical protein
MERNGTTSLANKVLNNCKQINVLFHQLEKHTNILFAVFLYLLIRDRPKILAELGEQCSVVAEERVKHVSTENEWEWRAIRIEDCVPFIEL